MPRHVLTDSTPAAHSCNPSKATQPSYCIAAVYCIATAQRLIALQPHIKLQLLVHLATRAEQAHQGRSLALLGGGNGHADGAAVDDMAGHLCQRAVPLRFIAKPHKAVALRSPCQRVSDDLQ